jgi:hypothetical protein
VTTTRDRGSSAAESGALRTVRRILLVTLVLGLAGTEVELLLLEHFEDWRQMIPLVLIGAALLVLVWHGVSKGAAAPVVLQVLMLIFILAGALGLTFHYRGNAEFELEMDPSVSGMTLFREALMGATPALAPGTMIQLALIGLAYTYRHPRLAHNVPGPQYRERNGASGRSASE